MTYDVYRYIFMGALIFSVVMLIVSVLLFAALNIPKVIGELSGATAKKAIRNIKEQAENVKDNKESTVNRQRGRLTDKISESGRLIRMETNQLGMGVVTEKIGTQEFAGGNETTVLTQNETAVLDKNETTVLSQDETTVLTQNDTTVLTQSNESVIGTLFEIEYEITYIHTNERIETYD